MNSPPETFYQHELLEMLLYSAVPRGDTNECAHALIERFGSIRGVMEASKEELQSVKGIGETAASTIKLTLELMRRYVADLNTSVTCYDRISKVVSFLHPKFLGATREQVYLLLFNNRMELLDSRILSVGSVNSADVPIQEILTKAIYSNASYGILAHNHPHGNTTPSRDDQVVTERVKNAFELIKVELIEHLVFSDKGYYPIMKRDYSIFRQPLAMGGFRNDPYENFYDLDEETYTFLPSL